MTGFASELVALNGITYNLELRTLNSKNCEVVLRTGANFRRFEPRLRKLLSEDLLRGKIDFSIEVYQGESSENNGLINFDARQFSELMDKIATVAENYEVEAKAYFPVVLNKCLQVFSGGDMQNSAALHEEEWQILEHSIKKLLLQVQQFRRVEGAQIQQSIGNCFAQIQKSIQEIRRLSPSRLEEIREILQKKIDSLLLDVSSLRLEQELFFYADRLDIAEEVQRIEAHLQYFSAVVEDKKEVQKGKKLNFIVLEIGRELNTIGAKAQCSLVQTEAIRAKEQLEQIKEQLSNVL